MFYCDCGIPVAKDQIVGHNQTCRAFYDKYGGLIGELCKHRMQIGQSHPYQQQQKAWVLYAISETFNRELHKDFNL